MPAAGRRPPSTPTGYGPARTRQTIGRPDGRDTARPSLRYNNMLYGNPLVTASSESRMLASFPSDMQVVGVLQPVQEASAVSDASGSRTSCPC